MSARTKWIIDLIDSCHVVDVDWLRYLADLANAIGAPNGAEMRLELWFRAKPPEQTAFAELLAMDARKRFEAVLSLGEAQDWNEDYADAVAEFGEGAIARDRLLQVSPPHSPSCDCKSRSSRLLAAVMTLAWLGVVGVGPAELTTVAGYATAVRDRDEGKNR